MLGGMTCPSFFLVVLIAATVRAAAPSPPEQPKTGPGGSDYRHGKVVSHSFDSGPQQYWILAPAEPRRETAPVVVFNHGWMGMHPAVYRGWLHHLVRRGNVVIFPRYQGGLLTPPWTFTDNAVLAVRRALARLKGGGHPAPEPGKFALVGHSAGAAISADMASLAEARGLPVPRALMCVQPGRGTRKARAIFFPAADYRKIPKETALLVLVGEDDRIVGREEARRIFQGTPQIPPDRKDYVLVHTDRHGAPPLVADHVSPASPMRPNPIIRGRRINALDYYAYWRLFDALLDFAFEGEHKERCLGDTPQQRFMGRWSDGTPVKPLAITDEP
jgi:acetyl esterase/lipase